MQKINICIIMPAYNAALTIEKVFERIPEATFKKVNSIIVVNDGSKDNTKEIILKLQKKYPKVVYLEHEKNKGYGAAQKTGFNEAIKRNADAALLLHSDGQYPPELMDQFLEPLLKNESDVVIGSRFLGTSFKSIRKGGMPIHKYIGNRVLTGIENVAYRMKMSEYHTGYTLYSKKALAEIPFNKLSDTFHFDGEMIMMSGIKKLRIKELSIPTRYAEEKSNLRPIKYGLDVLKIILKYLRGHYHRL